MTGPSKRNDDGSLVITTAKVLPSRGETSLEAGLPTGWKEVGWQVTVPWAQPNAAGRYLSQGPWRVPVEIGLAV